MLRAWEGEPAFLDNVTSSAKNIELVCEVAKWLLRETHQLVGVRFLESPDPKGPLLVQEVWDPRGPTISPNKEELARLAQVDPMTLAPQEREALLTGKLDFRYSIHWLKFAVFPAHDTPVFCSANLFNLAHPLGNCLHRALAWIHRTSSEERENDPVVGRLKDQITTLTSRYFTAEEVTPDLVAAFVDSAVAAGIHVPETVSTTPARIWWDSGAFRERKIRGPFGRVVAEHLPATF